MMNGDTMIVLCSVIASGMGLGAMLVNYGKHWGKIEAMVKQIRDELPVNRQERQALREAQQRQEHRLTALEMHCQTIHPERMP